MASTLADLLCRRAVGFADPVARVQFFRSLLPTLEPGEVDEAVGVLIERAGLRDTAAQVALLSIQVALAHRPPPPPRRELVPGEEPPPASGASAVENEARLPDYGRGRPLSLGERKSLARCPDRRLIDRVLRDPHPEVITMLLNNPRVTERDVVELCARRPGQGEVLARVFRNPKWAARPTVRRALAYNPATPEAIAAAVVPLLSPEDLRGVAHDEHLPLGVRRRCFEVLARLPPSPVDPSAQVH